MLENSLFHYTKLHKTAQFVRCICCKISSEKKKIQVWPPDLNDIQELYFAALHQ